MPSSADYIGYGSGPWSRGSWGEDQLAVFVDGNEATSGLGTASTITDNRFPATGVTATGVVNSVVVSIPESVEVTTVVGTTVLGEADAQETWTGWSSGPWSRGAWGTDVVIAVVSGVGGTTGLGTTSTITDNRFPATGVSATGAVNDVVVSIPKIFSVTGVFGTGDLGEARVEETWTGWGSGPWSRGTWGADTVIAVVSGVSGTTALGEEEITAGATASPSGVEATGVIDDVSIVAKAVVNVTNVTGTMVLGEEEITADAIVTVTGVSATGEEGDVTTRTENRFEVTGVSATTALGNESVIGGANIYVTGVQGTGQTQTFTLVWGEVDTAQTPNWTRIAA